MTVRPTIKIHLTHPKAKCPSRGSEDAAGLDLYATEDTCIIYRQRKIISTGIKMAIPSGMVGIIRPRSKLAKTFGVDVLAGVIDSDYRGEIKVILINTGSSNVNISAGDKVAQIVIQEHMSWLPIERCLSLDETPRGSAGIDSTDDRR